MIWSYVLFSIRIQTTCAHTRGGLLTVPHGVCSADLAAARERSPTLANTAAAASSESAITTTRARFDPIYSPLLAATPRSLDRSRATLWRIQPTRSYEPVDDALGRDYLRLRGL